MWGFPAMALIIFFYWACESDTKNSNIEREAEKKVWATKTDNFSGFDFRHSDCALLPKDGAEIHYEEHRHFRYGYVRVSTPLKEEVLEVALGECIRPIVLK